MTYEMVVSPCAAGREHPNKPAAQGGATVDYFMAQILVIDDEQSIRDTLELFLRKKGHTVVKASHGKEGLARFEELCPDVVILDIRLPDGNGLEILQQMRQQNCLSKVIMITAFQDMETTVQAMKYGAFDYVQKPLDIKVIEKTVERALQVLAIERGSSASPQQESEQLNVLVGKSENMVQIFKMIGVLCQNRVPVLIQGETGTGKELIARMIHQNSLYRDEPFVILDCSAVVENLLESELFGYEKGAFTGANRTNKGKIETAGKGTLFLDEIGELPLNVQGKFLGFLQRQEYMRVGGHQMLQAQCRVIAATNRNLAEMVQQGTFKEDLYYRLKVVTLYVPALRERISDMPLLVEHFLHKIHLKFGTETLQLQDGVMERLLLHPWTGNVRELENILVEASVRARGSVILTEDLDALLTREDELLPHLDSSTPDEASLEKQRIETTLELVQWNRSEAARRLGLSRPTLRTKMRKYDISEQ